VHWGRAVARRITPYVPPAAVIAIVGGGFLTLSLWRLFSELRRVTVLGGPMLAAWGNASLSLVIVYVGYRLANSQFDVDHRWTITAASIVGSIAGVAIQGYAFVIRIAEARPISAPIFPVVLLGALGAIIGAAMGFLYVSERAETERTREARDAMAFTNSLLRHDIRNGLQIVRSHAELVLRADDDRLRQSGEAIDRQVDTLDELIKEAQSVSKVLLEEADSGPIDFTEILVDAVETARDSHPDATFEADIPDGLSVEGTKALVPVVTNLLNNAVQHTSADAKVRVSATTSDGTVTVTVDDDGPGIPPAERERIFERDVSRNDEGGFGLHIVAMIVERSGGTVHVEDSDLGGAAFVVRLPAADVTGSVE